MHLRLRKARANAGFRTATSAIDAFGWPSSTYRAHENGQNCFNTATAKLYGEAYGVSASWLLLGEETIDHKKNKRARVKAHKHNCADQIFAAALLLKDDPSNHSLIKKIDDCLTSLKSKLNI